MFINFLIRKMSTAATIPGRALHYVFKIGDRGKNSNFFRNILGMKVLRHEEFKEGCEAECNGPYDNRWSKTMVGYGPESSHFVIELTYNYGVKSYQMGNDFGGITLKSSEALARAKKANYPIEIEEDVSVLRSPDGYKFYVLDEPQPTNRDPIYEVAINAINLEHSKQYWNGLLQMPILCECENSVTLAYDPAQCQLKIKESCTDIDRAQAYGRIAFGVPMAVLPKIQEIIQEAKRPILKPMITLSTPGKADVTVIILSDPDRHEICFVDEEGFGELSQMEEDGGAHLDKFIRKDPFQDKEDGGAPVADVKKD